MANNTSTSGTDTSWLDTLLGLANQYVQSKQKGTFTQVPWTPQQTALYNQFMSYTQPGGGPTYQYIMPQIDQALQNLNGITYKPQPTITSFNQLQPGFVSYAGRGTTPVDFSKLKSPWIPSTSGATPGAGGVPNDTPPAKGGGKMTETTPSPGFPGNETGPPGTGGTNFYNPETNPDPFAFMNDAQNQMPDPSSWSPDIWSKLGQIANSMGPTVKGALVSVQSGNPSPAALGIVASLYKMVFGGQQQNPAQNLPPGTVTNDASKAPVIGGNQGANPVNPFGQGVTAHDRQINAIMQQNPGINRETAEMLLREQPFANANTGWLDPSQMNPGNAGFSPWLNANLI